MKHNTQIKPGMNKKTAAALLSANSPKELRDTVNQNNIAKVFTHLLLLRRSLEAQDHTEYGKCMRNIAGLFQQPGDSDRTMFVMEQNQTAKDIESVLAKYGAKIDLGRIKCTMSTDGSIGSQGAAEIIKIAKASSGFLIGGFALETRVLCTLESLERIAGKFYKTRDIAMINMQIIMTGDGLFQAMNDRKRK